MDIFLPIYMRGRGRYLGKESFKDKLLRMLENAPGRRSGAGPWAEGSAEDRERGEPDAGLVVKESGTGGPEKSDGRKVQLAIVLRTQQWSSDPPFIASNAPADLANPAVTADVIRRTNLYAVKGGKRFHYRYAAADLAWEAAQMLPKNHPLLPRLYNTAGQWLSLRDAQAADRFYQAMVRHCARTPEGEAAEAKRWFLTDLPAQGDLPQLPAEFQPSVADR